MHLIPDKVENKFLFDIWLGFRVSPREPKRLRTILHLLVVKWWIASVEKKTQCNIQQNTEAMREKD